MPRKRTGIYKWIWGFFLKKKILSFPLNSVSPFPTHAKQRLIPSDHDRAEKAEFPVREYANESKGLSAKKKEPFPPNYIHLPFEPAQKRGQCLPMIFTPCKLNFMHKNMQINLKDFKLKKQLSLLNTIHLPSQPAQRRGRWLDAFQLRSRREKWALGTGICKWIENLFCLKIKTIPPNSPMASRRNQRSMPFESFESFERF